MHELDVLLGVVVLMVVLEDSLDVVVVGLLRENELKHETDDHQEVCGDRAPRRVPLDFFL